MVRSSTTLFKELGIFPARMMRNLQAAGDQIMAESIIMKLVSKGMGRQSAHELVRQCAQRALDTGASFLETLEHTSEISAIVDHTELSGALDPAGYLGVADAIVERVKAARID